MIMRKSHITMAIGNEMCFDTYKFICYLWNLAYYYEKMSYYNGIGNEMCFDTYKYKSIMDNRTPSLTCCELTYKFFCLWSAFLPLSFFHFPDRRSIVKWYFFAVDGWFASQFSNCQGVPSDHFHTPSSLSSYPPIHGHAVCWKNDTMNSLVSWFGIDARSPFCPASWHVLLASVHSFWASLNNL